MAWYRPTCRGVVCLSLLLVPAIATADPLPSGSSFLSKELRAQQADEAANPGMLWVGAGAELWRKVESASGKSCASCHGDAKANMRGVATRYPRFDLRADRLFNLEGRINQCRIDHLNAIPFVYGSDELLALTAFVARQSKGIPMHITIDGPARPYYERGKTYFHRRRGQLNISCAQCHDGLAGRKLRGDTISHGLGTDYPVYRLEWQSLGSLHRRFRSCAAGVRAVQHAPGSQIYLELELFLAKRAEGVPINSPGIRP